jgi:tetratricopeptide (TPR) repeat protein
MTVYRAGRRRPLPSKPFKKISTDKIVNGSLPDNKSSFDAQDLDGMLARVQQHIDMFQYEEARDLSLRAVLLAPEDADIRYQLGSICLELGDFQGGFENIRLSLNLEPETTPDRFFAFAQLIPGREAVQVYEHGMKVYVESGSDSSEVKRKVSTACCAAAEIFMTDLCDDEDAEIQCGGWLERALSTDPTNPEVFRVLADLRMCQEKPQEAREFVLRACQLWSEELERLINPSENESVELLAEIPSYESRISAAKILIELGDSDLIEQAVNLLEQLLKEDDSVLMTWYLLGLALKTSQNIQALEDAIEGSLRVARRDGHICYPEMQTDDELVQEILVWSRDLGMQIDLDAVEEEEAEEAVMEIEEALEEAEKLDQAESN